MLNKCITTEEACQDQHYLDYVANVSPVLTVLTKQPSFKYSVGQGGHNEQGKEYYGGENQGAGCVVGAVAEAGESGGDRLHDISQAFLTREDGSAENISSWLNTSCEKRGWFVAGSCEDGHNFAKVVSCGKEWCEVCGQDDSIAHNRRFARWLPKVEQMGTMGYFVFTLPESVRGKYRTKKALGSLGHKIQELLKSYGYSRGLRRWHWFGEKSVKYHPHLNCLVDGGFLPSGELDAIKRGYASLLGVDLADVNYHYRRTPGRIVHTLKYVTRATFRDWEWDIELASELRGFRNMVVWGRGEWGDDLSWSLSDLKGKPKGEVEGMDIEAINSLGTGKCPCCGKPVKWNREVLPIGLLDMVEKQPLGAGYYRLADMPSREDWQRQKAGLT